jgi:hypothetical protein
VNIKSDILFEDVTGRMNRSGRFRTLPIIFEATKLSKELGSFLAMANRDYARNYTLFISIFKISLLM